jgi:hypothetical protein
VAELKQEGEQEDQLASRIEEARAAGKRSIEWSGRLPDALESKLAKLGYSVKNTHQPSDFDGPGTMPSYAISGW